MFFPSNTFSGCYLSTFTQYREFYLGISTPRQFNSSVIWKFKSTTNLFTFCMKSSASHRQALSSFEEVDPNILGLQSKIVNFQKKQKEQSKCTDGYYGWIKTGVKLNETEEVVSNQIMQSCSNVLELMRKEKDYEEHQLFCDKWQSEHQRCISIIAMRRPVRSP